MVLLNCLAEDVRVWVRERKPKSSEEAGQFAEDFLQAREIQESEGRTKMTKERRSLPGNCPSCRLAGYSASNYPKPRERARDGNPNPSNGKKNRKQEREIYCFNCKEKGHMSFKCPKSSGLYCDESKSERPAEDMDVYRSGSINSIMVEDIILDTGVSRTQVREDSVLPCALMDGKATIRCAHGDTIAYVIQTLYFLCSPIVPWSCTKGGLRKATTYLMMTMRCGKRKHTPSKCQGLDRGRRTIRAGSRL